MSIQKLKKAENPYEPIDRDAIQAIKNPVALAIWVYLLSKPNNWNVNKEELKKHFNIGQDRLLKAFKELRELGLYEIVREKNKKGQFVKNDLVVYPHLRKPENTDNRNTEKPQVRKTVFTEIHTDIKEEENIKDNRIKSIRDNKTPLTPQGELDLPEWLDKKTWNDWVVFRKEKKKKLTPMSIKRQIKFLEQYKSQHTAIIEQSIRNGWTGLFPIKAKQWTEEDFAEFGL